VVSVLRTLRPSRPSNPVIALLSLQLVTLDAELISDTPRIPNRTTASRANLANTIVLIPSILIVCVGEQFSRAQFSVRISRLTVGLIALRPFNRR
jgi:hypothetical protein